MSKILVVGNVLKDTYLQLDERENRFERDERGVNWLDMSFDGAAWKYFHRTSVYSGAAVSLSVLTQLGVTAEISHVRTTLRQGEIEWQDAPVIYRYILSCKDEVSYLVPSGRVETEWQEPAEVPEWILVDRSAVVAERLVGAIWQYQQEHPGVKLAVHLAKRLTPAARRLAGFADLVFVEDEPVKTTAQVCHLGRKRLTLGTAEENWEMERVDTMTHLTIFSTMAATVLAVLSQGGDEREALLWAKLNIEAASLDRSPTRERLEQLAAAEIEKRRNVRLLARELMEPGRGVLAIDEAPERLNRRLEAQGLEARAERRKEFYELLLTTPHLERRLSGVILSEENARMKLSNGRTLLEQAILKGVMPGIKADKGLSEGADGEKYTLGEERLAERLKNYYGRGFRFAKWRAVFESDNGKPGYFALEENTRRMAEFAKQCQLAGLVPVVEPEVLVGERTTLPECVRATARVLIRTLEQLRARHVELDKLVLKVNLLVAGKKVEVKSTEVGFATAKVLGMLIPAEVAGVLILSGGREPQQILADLEALQAEGGLPCRTSFSFSRALENPVLEAWQAEADAAQRARVAQATLLKYLDRYLAALK